MHGTERYTNRELSWLAFNRRVLALAEDADLPLLERVKFLAIHASNLDEFFQVRVSGLQTLLEAGVASRGPDGLTTGQQLQLIHDLVTEQYKVGSRLFLDELAPSLTDAGIALSAYDDLDGEHRAWLDDQFEGRVFPVLTPLAVDPAHPFPYISDLSLNLGVHVRRPDDEQSSFARVKVPPLLPRFLLLPDHTGYVPLEDVIAHHLDHLFRGMQIEGHSTFRVTRNADIDINDDEADDLLLEVESQLARRRFGRPVRLEAASDTNAEALELLQRELQLDSSYVYVVDGPLDPAGLWSLYGVDRPDLKFPGHTPRRPRRLEHADRAGRSIFATLREADVLVHHPYESFNDTVTEFISQAAHDDDVLAIKMTMYRTSERTPIVNSLIAAAESGKQVVVVVEIQARFDEQANIEWARILEQAGVHVAYGVVGLKTHCKTALVVRQERDRIRRYSHIGTGNYNADTARIYEDVGLLTADDDVGADVSELFNALTGYSDQRRYRKLVVSPHSTRSRLLALIESEGAHPDGEIVLKMNSLVDERIIEALYAASARGCRVDLVIRGICCLVPQTPGLSDNIRVLSVVGQFLEHSRIYRFGSAARGRTYLIGSADAMPRNLDGRVEALVPVDDPRLAARMDDIIDMYLEPSTKAWTLTGTDGWELRGTDDVQNRLIDLQEADHHP